MALPVLWFIRKEITKQVSYELLALRAIKIFSKDLNWSSVWINRLRLDSGSFAPSLRYEKWEIHTVFPHFPYLVWRQNLSLSALVDLFRASFFILCSIFYHNLRKTAMSFGCASWFFRLKKRESCATIFPPFVNTKWRNLSPSRFKAGGEGIKC